MAFVIPWKRFGSKNINFVKSKAWKVLEKFFSHVRLKMFFSILQTTFRVGVSTYHGA